MEDKSFNPHLTLARFRPQARTAVQEFIESLAERELSAGGGMCSTVDLMQSQLSPKGSTYTPLVSIKLEEPE
jgi:2'-5' RNA ligase